ncbi:polysaccharide biosynthesis protein [Flavobacterium sp. DGU38]|uniref:Polysaccharide biosynthesis protein n=1 Tax=Flavobacterium calami TaxID=3139144 RepID=A0ABU9IJK7_9FLAO
MNIRQILNTIGIDGAIFYTVLARVLQGGGGVISILFIASFLTKVEQGYYYTFGSILAIQIFFELGLSGIITQFTAHEFANLKWINNYELEGSPEAMSRLSSLLHFCIKWFTVIAFLLFFILIITGYIFFQKYGKGDSSVSWVLPWIIIAAATASSLVVTPILSFLEGLGKVKDVAVIRLIQQCSQIFILFICLISGLKLYSSPIANVISLIIAPIFIIYSSNLNRLKFIWTQLQHWKVSYKLEIFPFQWRIALSWISGYFMYQLFNPVIFATEGPVVAGQMGITLAVLNGVLTVSLSWINTKIPLLSSLVAQKNYEMLDNVFYRTMKQSNFISFICLAILISGVAFLKYKELTIGNRFLPLLPLILLSVTTFVNQFVAGLAIYLRCHKKEPFLIFSIVMGVLTAISTLLLGKIYGLIGIVAGYSALTVFVSLIWALCIFKVKKNAWHTT